MATDAEIIREYHETQMTYRVALARAMSKDEFLALPQDVRGARAGLECIEEAERARDATIAFEAMKSEREERWIAAHEYSTAWRRGAATT